MPDPAVSPDTLLIRAAAAQDLADLVELVNLPGVRHGTLRLPYTGASFVERRLAPDPLVHNLIGCVGGKAIAWAMLLRQTGRTAHLGEIVVMVHDDHAGRGVGRRMMGALIELADDWLGLVRLELTVNVDNAPAIRLYEGLGFRREGTQRAATLRAGRLVDAHMMARLRAPVAPDPEAGDA